MSIGAYRLPPEIESGATGGPEFATIIQEAVSGREQRIKQWAKCRAKYDIGYSILDSTNPTGSYRAVVALFYGHNGQFSPFRFKDWNDYQATDANFGTGNGVATTFQLSKTYDPQKILLGTTGSLTYTREIYLLSNTPVIKVNGSTMTVVTDYTISATGLVTFVVAPTNGHALTWTGEFDIPVRFNTDYLPITMNEVLLATFGGISLREVIGSDEL